MTTCRTNDANDANDAGNDAPSGGALARTSVVEHVHHTASARAAEVDAPPDVCWAVQSGGVVPGFPARCWYGAGHIGGHAWEADRASAEEGFALVALPLGWVVGGLLALVLWLVDR